MIGTLRQWLTAFRDGAQRQALASVLEPMVDRYATKILRDPGLVIKTAGSAIVKAGNAFHAAVTGKLVTKAANTDMAALSGTVANAAFNVYCFFIDAAGTLTSAMGTAGASLAAVKFPPFPESKALIGFIIVNPTGTGNFVGGTTALDDVTVVPNVVYIDGNDLGNFDPTVVIS